MMSEALSLMSVMREEMMLWAPWSGWCSCISLREEGKPLPRVGEWGNTPLMGEWGNTPRVGEWGNAGDRGEGGPRPAIGIGES